MSSAAALRDAELGQSEDEDLDELAWSDSARVTVATQVSAVLLSSTWLSIDEAMRIWCLPLALVYVSGTAATLRNRRSLGSWVQVGISSLASTAYSLSGRGGRRRAWIFGGACMYACEAALWRGQTHDLVSLAFARFQRLLFATIVVTTVWGMPVLYSAASALESDATAIGDSSLGDATPEGIARHFAAAILYGGTAFLLSVSAAVWLRLYRIAPELFRLLVVVAAVGASAGLVLRFVCRAPDEAMLTGASTASFAAMAALVLYDRHASQAIVALAIGLYAAYRTLPRPKLAAVCFLALLGVKFAFACHLHHLGSRRQRHLPRLDAWPPALAALFPATAS